MPAFLARDERAGGEERFTRRLVQHDKQRRTALLQLAPELGGGRSSGCGTSRSRSFLLALLLLRLVLPLRGGMVAQPYLLLVVDGLLYLVVDIALATELPALVGASGVLAALAGAAGASAGFAQRALVRRPAAAERG